MVVVVVGGSVDVVVVVLVVVEVLLVVVGATVVGVGCVVVKTEAASPLQAVISTLNARMTDTTCRIVGPLRAVADPRSAATSWPIDGRR